MKVTVDANILFAALIADGETRRLWFNPDVELYAPEFIVREFLSKFREITPKYKGNPLEWETLVDKTLSHVKLVSDAALTPYLSAASTLISDSNDWLYVACALKEDTIIWSNDKGFLEQKRIKVKNTTETRKEVGGL